MALRTDEWAVLAGGLGAIAWVYWYFFVAGKTSVTAAAGPGGVQEVTVLVKGGYQPAQVRVRHGAPVRIIFDRRESDPCSEEVVFPDFAVRRFLPPNRRTAVELSPTATGTFGFTCGMGMLHGTLIVE
jgi:plastocyanin domain-containing protein